MEFRDIPHLRIAILRVFRSIFAPQGAWMLEFNQRQFNVRRLPTFLNRHFSNEQSRVESASIRPPVLVGR